MHTIDDESASGQEIQYNATPQEFFVTGIFGVVIYGLLLAISSYNVRLYLKSVANAGSSSSSQTFSKTSNRFFAAVLCMSLFEIPRFFSFIVEKNYGNSLFYVLHIISNVFFFAGFSIICYQYQCILQLGSYFKVIYGIQGLMVANIFFGIIDMIAIFACLGSSSLQDFFVSGGFEVLTFIEGVRNCVYSGLLFYFGIKLIRKFKQYSQNTSQLNQKLIRNNNIFSKALIRVTVVISISTLCFLLRVIMLIIKMAALHSQKVVTTEVFTLFGFGWFLIGDFIPRAFPSIAFMLLMQQSKRIGTASEGSHETREIRTTSDDFQFIKLETNNRSMVDRARSKVSKHEGLTLDETNRFLHGLDNFIDEDACSYNDNDHDEGYSSDEESYSEYNSHDCEDDLFTIPFMYNSGSNHG